MLTVVSYIVTKTINCLRLVKNIIFSGDLVDRLNRMEQIIEQLDLIVYDNGGRIIKLESKHKSVKMVDTSTQTEDINTVDKDSNELLAHRKSKVKKSKTRFMPYRSAKNKALIAFRVQSASI